jgi:predicted nuclease of predicted toxin-antitoxin system
VKLLFDQNLSPDLVKRLADLYPGSAHVYHLGIDRVADKELRDYARREAFVIVTKDADFSDLCILLGFPPKVIWIRRGNCSTATIESILRGHTDDIESLRQDEVMGILTLF